MQGEGVYVIETKSKQCTNYNPCVIKVRTYSLLLNVFVESKTPTPPSSADSGLGRRKKKRKKPKGYNAASRGQYAMYSAMSPVTELHAFPKARPLPAVGESCMNDIGSRTESSRYEVVYVCEYLTY